MIAYDLDGTLAETDYTNVYSKEGLTTIYENAPVIYKPKSPFIVITARQINGLQDRIATRQWLQDNFGNLFKNIYYVSGSQDQIVKKKLEILKRYNIVEFVDNNKAILQKMKEADPSLKLYYMSKDGTKTLY